jgi:hypothetical protein
MSNPAGGNSNPLRSKLQALGAGTYDPAFMAQYKNPNVSTNPSAPPPFIQPANPMLDQSKLIRRKMILYSEDRNDRAGSTTSSFEITLSQAVDEVVKIELRSFVVPTGIFNVVENNQTWNFTFAWTAANSTLPSPPANNSPAPFNVNIAVGAYSPDSLVVAVVAALNSAISYYLGDRDDWITGQLNASQKIELYSIDKGLTFTWNSSSQPDAGVLYGANVGGPITAVNSGGIWGTTDYYYLVFPNKITLPLHDLICVQSAALGSKLVCAEGAASGFNCFTTIPIPDQARPIQVRFDNTLDSTYFDPQKSANNTLRTIDINITDINGVILDLRGSPCLLEFDFVQKVKPDTLGI